MTIESQRGATHYRVNPDNPCVVQIQTGPGRAWYFHSEFSNPAKARTAVMRLGRPQPHTQGEVSDGPLSLLR